MSNGEHRSKVQYPRFWIGLGIGAVAVLVVLVVIIAIKQIFPSGGNSNHKPVPPPSLTTQKLTPTPRETTRKLFGPWHLYAGSGTGAPKLVMLDSSGAVEVSSKTVAVASNWQIQAPIEIVAEQNGATTVTISLGDNDIYKLSYGQAFVMSDQPDWVYAFSRSSSGKVKLVGTKVSALSNQS